MSRTVQQYIDLMAHAIGKTPDSRHVLLTVLNNAGNYIFGYAPWRWRKTKATVGSVEDVDYFVPPTDFAQLLEVGIDNTDGTPGAFLRVQPTTLEHMTRMKQAFTAPIGGTLYIDFESTVAASGAANALPRWYCYPTPTADDDPIIEVVYNRRWVNIPTNFTVNDLVPIPVQFDMALMLAGRAFAVLLENQSSPIELGAANAELDRLKQEFGGVQTDFGPVRGGALSRPRHDRHVILGDVTF